MLNPVGVVHGGGEQAKVVNVPLVDHVLTDVVGLVPVVAHIACACHS